jgi:surfeit locus 1 family protein
VEIGKFQFQPRLLPTVATLILLPVLVALGFWQLDRAEQKRALAAAFAARAADAPVRLDGSQHNAEAMASRRVVVVGRYLPERQILLDNQIHQGRAGYHVLTPLRIHNTGTLVLVNRGWVPLGPSRRQLPDISVTGDELSVRGLVHQPSPPPIQLGETGDQVPGWPKVVQRLDLSALAERFGAPLLPYTVRLAPEEEHGYVREWHAYYGAGPGKHQAYAVQWFGLALVLLIVYFALHLRPKAERSETHTE